MDKKITGIIVTGGKSSRMGEDKAQILFKGKPLAQWSIDALRPICSEIIICSNNPKHTYQNTKRVTDIPGFQGPLSGLASGLKTSKSDLNIVLACDNPNVTVPLLQNMIRELGKHQGVVLMDKKGTIHPLIACYKIDILTQINKVLKSNRQSMMHVLSLIDYIPFTSDNDSNALNVNSKNELL